jgi:hypothetical protein
MLHVYLEQDHSLPSVHPVLEQESPRCVPRNLPQIDTNTSGSNIKEALRSTSRLPRNLVAQEGYAYGILPYKKACRSLYYGTRQLGAPHAHEQENATLYESQ